jgi:hypothetical protein
MKLANLTGFNLPALAPNHPSQRVLTASLNKLPHHPHSNAPTLFWDAHYFGLDQVCHFQTATPEQQTQILDLANRDLLEEIYWIEQAGVGYMAKMVLLAESREERLLYGLFAADEASHLAMIADFLGNNPMFQGDSFLTYMGQLLESSDKVFLITLMQVVLEGWGLHHYRSLAKGCLDSKLAQVLQGFLDAEARHHALGVTSLEGHGIYADQSLREISIALTHFLGMVQVGPQRLLGAIDLTLGYLSRADKIKILQELQTEYQSNHRLQLLRSLMVNTVPNSILQSLEEQGSFQAYPAEQCIMG